MCYIASGVAIHVHTRTHTPLHPHGGIWGMTQIIDRSYAQAKAKSPKGRY